MDTERRIIAERILQIENEAIIDLIFDNSHNLMNVELERHRRIVDKGRDYLGMILIVLGIIVGTGNVVFKDTLGLTLEKGNYIFIAIIASYLFSITSLVVSSFTYFNVSFIHKFLWEDFEDITYVPSVKEKEFHYYKCSQLVNTWHRIRLLRKLNERLIIRLKKASFLALGGILFILISLFIVLLNNII